MPAVAAPQPFEYVDSHHCRLAAPRELVHGQHLAHQFEVAHHDLANGTHINREYVPISIRKRAMPVWKCRGLVNFYLLKAGLQVLRLTNWVTIVYLATISMANI